MNIFIPILHIPYEGYAAPRIAFKTEEATRAWLAEPNQLKELEDCDWDIYEIEFKE